MSDAQQPEDEEPYIVTRGKPPREYQFKPGQSGNPKGKPKGSKNLATQVREEMERKIEATIQGQRKRIPTREAMAKSLVNKALKGDPKAFAQCLALDNRGSVGGGAALDPADMEAILEDDEAILQRYLARKTVESGDA